MALARKKLNEIRELVKATVMPLPALIKYTPVPRGFCPFLSLFICLLPL